MPDIEELLLVRSLRRDSILSLSGLVTHGELGISVAIGNFEIDLGEVPVRIVYLHGARVWS